MSIIEFAVVIALLATFAVLAIGLVSMLRGGDFNRRHSNRLMRARIITQAATVVMLVIYFFSRGA